MSRDKATYTVQTVEKALDLLEALTEETTDATLPQLADRLELSRNKVFRILATFENKGFVEREDKSGCYRIGLSAIELAQKCIKTASLIQHARPVMEGLARKLDEAVYMTVLKDDEVLFLDMVDCDQQIKAAPLIGKRFPFFTNAAGKAIKAFESRDLLPKAWARNKGSNGMPDITILERELNVIREQGVAVDNGGLGEDIVSVAVAIKDYAGKIVGALTLLAPSFRMVTERLEQEIIPSLMESADLLSLKFGHARI